MTTAYIFPGQGSQYVGMGRDLAAASPGARAVFDRADDALGFAISSLCFEGPDTQLKLTANTQPAILTASIAALEAARALGAPEPEFVAGHSLGEYSAMVAAGVLLLEDAVRLVRARGEYMQEAVPAGAGAMAAVLGLDRESIAAGCLEAAGDDVCAPANYNCPGQTVIAGTRAAVDRARDVLKRLGAKRVIELEVSAPFHTALMQPAADRLALLLEAVDFSDPRFPVMVNATASLVLTAADARAVLLKQVAAPVLWEQSVEALVGMGVSRFVEIGPGKVLTGLVRKIAKGVETANVERLEDIDGAFAAGTAGD